MRAWLFAISKHNKRTIYRKRSTHVNAHRFILSELVIDMFRSLVELEIVVLLIN